MTISEGRDGRHFRDQPVDLFPAALFVKDVLRVRIESRERTHCRFKHPHRVGIVVKTVHHLLDALVDKSVVSNVPDPVLELRGGGQLAVQQQVSNFQIAALFSKLVDGKPAILEYALVAVDKRDPALAGRRIHVSRIIGHQAKVAVRNFDLPEIQGLDCFVLNPDLVLFPGAIVGNGQSVSTHLSRSQPSN